MSRCMTFSAAYVHQGAAIVGPKEHNGPLGALFDGYLEDLYGGMPNFEHAEVHLLELSFQKMLQKNQIEESALNVMIGGDLQNQLGASHYFMREHPLPFIGMYAACSTSTLCMLEAGMLLEAGYAVQTAVFVSSHYGASERQFRYPLEYGIQKKPTVTSTVTGAGCLCISKKPSDIRIKEGIISQIVDQKESDPNDMGSAMVMAAYQTIMDYLDAHPDTVPDVIVTGDLSALGSAILRDLLGQQNPELAKRHQDCGLLMYDRKKQPVFAGGSGAACSMCTLIAYYLPRLRKKEVKSILLVATGALLNPMMVQQKDSIPCIAHGVVLEAIG